MLSIDLMLYIYSIINQQQLDVHTEQGILELKVSSSQIVNSYKSYLPIGKSPYTKAPIQHGGTL